MSEATGNTGQRRRGSGPAGDGVGESGDTRPVSAAVKAVALDAVAVAALIPHAGAMSLWDAVVGWDDASIRLRTRSHGDADHPLRSHGQLRAVHLCEYGAQAMAVHGGLRARAAGATGARPGLLVALRAVQLHVARIDTLGGDLEGEAELLVDGDAGWQYAFRILHRGQLLAEGRAAVMLNSGS